MIIKRKGKFLVFLLVIFLLTNMLPFSSASNVNPKKVSLFSGGETSRMETEKSYMGLAFRFCLLSNGVKIGKDNIVSLRNATVCVDGENKKILALGVVMSNDTKVGENPDLFTRENVSQRTIDIPVKYLLGQDSESILYAARITNIPFSQENAIIYARPYVEYEEAPGTSLVQYADIVLDNVSGKERMYASDLTSMDWTVGTIHAETGLNTKSRISIRSDYINDLNVMVRVPDDVIMRAFFYGVDGYRFSKDITDWTVLSEVLSSEDCTNARLVAQSVKETIINDASVFALSFSVRYAKNGERLPVAFQMGGFWSTDGTEAYKTNRIRTEFLPLQDVLISVSSNVQYQIFYYDEDKLFIYSTEAFDAETRLLTDAIEKPNVRPARYFRLIARHSANETIGENIYQCASHVFFNLSGSDAYRSVANTMNPMVFAEDTPINAGVKNTILNFNQLIDITYTPMANIPQTQGDLVMGKQQTGLPYSSTRVEALFVPSNVGFYTFLSSVKNPNSYLYTVDLEEKFNNANGKTYYGTVCSTACEYALNIVPMYSTHQWLEIPGISVNDKQGVQGLELCDMIVGAGHVVMITNIIRDAKGTVVQVTVSEAAGANTKRKNYTAEKLAERFPEKDYTYCRYLKIADVQHTPIDYLTADSEEGFNMDIIPRKGDKANWLLGDVVEIDVLQPADYTYVEWYYAGQKQQTIPLDELEVTENGCLVSLQNLEAGSYKARLIGAKGVSEYCYWMVVDASSSALLTAEGNVQVSFNSSVGVPLYVQWSNGKTNGTIYIDLLTAEQIADGEVILPPASKNFKVRVAFQTEYGIIHSALPEAIVIS